MNTISSPIFVQLIKSLSMVIILLCVKKMNQVINLINLKLVVESGLQNIKIFSAKVTPKIGQIKYLLLILC